MQFDTENHIIKLCIEGMEMEGHGKHEEAKNIFMKAWEESTNDFEKYTSAHYVARHQNTISDKLKWDETALECALKIPGDTIKNSLPSLYLNIAKCYEDLNDFKHAQLNYKEAHSYITYLSEDNYGSMIKNGIQKGLERTSGCKF